MSAAKPMTRAELAELLHEARRQVVAVGNQELHNRLMDAEESVRAGETPAKEPADGE